MRVKNKSGAFGRKLAKLRSDRGWRLMQLAAWSGLSWSMIGRIERGEREPSFRVACALADALNVPVQAFRDE